MSRASDAASTDDFARYCCGDPDCPNDCEREEPPVATTPRLWPLDEAEKEWHRVQSRLLAQQRRDVDRLRLDTIIRRFGGTT